MALNPIVFTEKVVRSFLRYQLTAYPFADPRLHLQMRQLLSLDETRSSPLLKGPYISLSRPFREGASVQGLIDAGIFHPHMRQRIPAAITNVYGHQEEAIRAIHDRRTTLVSTGTGSGKTEAFLYPIVSKCLQLKDENAPPGISAVIVYPMNALAEDQLLRLRSLLAGTGISFGMYVGKTPEYEKDVAGIRLPVGSSRADYEARLKSVRAERRQETVFPPEELRSREAMRTPGMQPRILLTNAKQLELLLTRQRDVELFSGARLDFLVFDEAHTFSGAQGAETACLIRRLRAFCGRDAQETVCVATSATIVDRDNPGAARTFASRFFGVAPESVATVGEAYEEETWATDRILTPAPKDPAAVLAACVTAVEDETGSAVRTVYQALTGNSLEGAEWTEALYDTLARNEVVYHLNELLAKPVALDDLTNDIPRRIGRDITEAEILAWLTLGAAARKDNRPLLRPVVHGFIRGISGAVVSFPKTDGGPRLWLAAEDEIDSTDHEGQFAHFPVMTCTTCGQHYYTTFLKDFEFTADAPGGGQAEGDGSYWEPLDEAQGGQRAILIDRLAGESDDEELEEHRKTAPLFICRHCGTAHPDATNRCRHCSATGEMEPLFTIRQNPKNPGYLTSCLSCGANGRKIYTTYREPSRPVRATNVADVHVLAQDMVHHSERQRLLIFCDNRQDAAFQAGWMKDHARRFRLRALMADALKNGPVSVGDLARFVDEKLEGDEALSRALVPEVWRVARKEGSGGLHEKERIKFVRIQVLREVTVSPRQPIGLEPWGRMKVEYQGLDASLTWMQENANVLGLPANDLRDGVASVLDYLRRKRILHDPEREIFTHYWQDGDLEIIQGYLPQLGAPVGTKLRRAGDEKPALVNQWLSSAGETTMRQIARKWGVKPDNVESFLDGLFELLVKRGLLKPVTLKGAKGRALPNVSGVYQLDADLLRMEPSHGAWRCTDCRRRSARRTPHMKCTAWRCDGQLEFVKEDPDNYDLQLLDEGYSMLRPEEHTAMVPHDERERLENLFKGESDAVNAFVCTPTLELGVDIGQLDTVLMRNVPPLPANYWQRAGRAGRRHRMAVDLTYCRPLSHDRAYFADPIKMLAGRVDPPAFNLRNELMVAKHVHATVITRLHYYTRDESRDEDERTAIDATLRTCLPDRVSHFLFEQGVLRSQPFDLGPLDLLIRNNVDDLTAYVSRAFVQGWPQADAEVATPEKLREHVLAFVPGLRDVVVRLERRLRWAMAQIKRLNKLRESQGTLEPEDDSLFKRCDALIKRLKGVTRAARREAEGYDDVNTFNMLAAEGFLPGYGLEVGSVLATAEIPYWNFGAMQFTLPRPPAVALREYVPGNLIYANGNRFVARRFHRDADEQREEMPWYDVSIERQAVKETNVIGGAGALSAERLQTMPVCDVDLTHQAYISDEEEVRFQLGVAIYGKERQQHNGGVAYKWGAQDVHHRHGVRMRLINVGATTAIQRFQTFGYPVCTVCGQSVSPLSSDAQLDHFEEQHKERCGRKVVPIGFHADVAADALSLPACPDHATAYSILETIRFAAARVLDMHVDDLQVLVIGHVDREEVDALLWDPMAGGSGLLDQLCSRFAEIVAVAREIVEKCPAACETSCPDCLQTFRNGFYHKYLNRHVAHANLTAWGNALAKAHDIPATQPAQSQVQAAQPVNLSEQRLKHLLLAAGFDEGIRGEQIRLDPAIGTTTPDVIYRAAHHDQDEGICIYLDGMSAALHGDPERRAKDQEIRSWLRNNGYEVIEIPDSDLYDEGAMTRHFRKLAGYLRDDALRDRVRNDTSWYQDVEKAEDERHPVVRVVVPGPNDKWVRCVPLAPLKVAGGNFGDPNNLIEWDGEWVEVDGTRRLREGMFVAQVVGKSMEPRIPDGAYCLFQGGGVAGSRQGRIVLVELRDAVDPETGERYTVKKYTSEKAEADDETWRHTRITLMPLNRDFDPIELRVDDEDSLDVVAELVEVLGT